MKKLILDVDHVICDHGFLELINNFLGSNYKIEDFKDYYIDDLVFKDEETKQAFYEYWVANDCYEYASFYPGAYDVIKELNEVYDIYICSSCVVTINPYLKQESGIFLKKKYDYLIKNLPFLNPKKFIFTGSKNLFAADVQIDDRIQNLMNDIPQKMLFNAYHNHNVSEDEMKKYNIIRVNNWEEIKEILL